jgi:N-6 DNA Methylase
MASLDRNLRRELERTVKQARKTAEAGARKAIERLGVGDAEAPAGLNAAAKSLRLRLRAHGRQLGDRREGRRQTQETKRLVAECAYEHWHRMLFARFLAENDLLIEPEHGVAITLDECKELAREQRQDWLTLASAFAVRMLPQIFRPGDPVLGVHLPPETRSELEDHLKGLPREVFLADDSLGWVYQFWQADRKDEVNASETKIGADELPAVTQLFTEDYMVLFLLHNTLGAWWAGKVLAARPELATSAGSEEELRNACAVGDVTWTSLRFVRDPAKQAMGQDLGRASQPVRNEEGRPGKAVPQERVPQEGVPQASHPQEAPWRPAAGTFDGWPRAARDITVLDPCMGSGHFLVFALPILVALRMTEDGLSRPGAVDAVLRDNLFGLEIDPRCTQIAAFNLALAAWKMAGYRPLPLLNLACSGLGPSASEDEWLKLAEERGMSRRTAILGREAILNGLRHLYALFSDAPTLGSLIDPNALSADLLTADYETLKPYLNAALTAEQDVETHERAVAAAGMVKAAELLAGEYTLVITNVPYLGRGKQDDILKRHLEGHYAEGKADLSTAFVLRCLELCTTAGTIALVTPQSWLFLTTYKKLRERLLQSHSWNCIVRLGVNAFQDMNWWAATTALLVLSRAEPAVNHCMAGIDVSADKRQDLKAAMLRGDASAELCYVPQAGQRKNPDAAIKLGSVVSEELLSQYASCFQGISTGDNAQFVANFWEHDQTDHLTYLQSAPEIPAMFGGCEYLVKKQLLNESFGYGAIRGRGAWGSQGLAMSQTGRLRFVRYMGTVFTNTAPVIVTASESTLPALWAFAEAGEFEREIRATNQKVSIDNGYVTKVPFDLGRWQQVASERYPDGLPDPESRDPTQWLFHGRPEQSTAPLLVAVARLLDYRWPAELDPDMRLSQRARELVRRCDELLPHVDNDGIVCLTSIKGEAPAADRVNALLADAFGPDWSAGKLASLLADVGFSGKTLDDWLRDGFFENHCAIFHNRPFIWHLWDGRQDGFHALINYHRLVGRASQPDQKDGLGRPSHEHEGRRSLEKLIYTYLGDWIERQRAEQKRELEGVDARLAAAVHLKAELEKILVGEPPYDLFVRWKPLHQQPISWEPDINDGVRINIRPFLTARPLGARAKNACILRVTPRIKWDKDRGKEPERPKGEYPWFWGWDGQTQDFAGGAKFDGNRWNDLHYTTAFKKAARERKK